MKNSVYLKDVVTLQLDENKCTGCGMCLDVCPHEVFKMNSKHAVIKDREDHAPAETVIRPLVFVARNDQS